MEGSEKSQIMSEVENWVPTRLVETPEVSEADSLSSYLSAPSSIPAEEQQTDDLTFDIINKETISLDQVPVEQKLAELSPHVVIKEICLNSIATEQHVAEASSDINRNEEMNSTLIPTEEQSDDASLGFISTEPVAVEDSEHQKDITEHQKDDCEQNQIVTATENADDISLGISITQKATLSLSLSSLDNLSEDIIDKQKSPSPQGNLSGDISDKQKSPLTSPSEKGDNLLFHIISEHKTSLCPIPIEETDNLSFDIPQKQNQSSSSLSIDHVNEHLIPSVEQKTKLSPTLNQDELAFDVVNKQNETRSDPILTQSFDVNKQNETSSNPMLTHDSSPDIAKKQNISPSPDPIQKMDSSSLNIIMKRKRGSSPISAEDDLSFEIIKKQKICSSPAKQVNNVSFDSSEKQKTNLNPSPIQVDEVLFHSIEKQKTSLSPNSTQEDLSFDYVKKQITTNLSQISTEEVGVLSFDATKKQNTCLSSNLTNEMHRPASPFDIVMKPSSSPIPIEQAVELSFDVIKKQNTSLSPSEKVNNLSFDVLKKQKTSSSLIPTEQNDNSSFDVPAQPETSLVITPTEQKSNLSFDIISKQNHSLTVDPPEQQTDELSLDMKDSLTPNPTDQQADDLSFDIISRQKLSLTPISSGCGNHDRSSPKGGPVVHIFEEDTRSSWSVDSAKVPFKETAIDDDSQNSSSSQKKKSSDDDDVKHAFSPENLFEYMWPQSNGEFFFLQEQVSDYLSVKSFKRKYPDLTRRQVELDEKRLLREKGIVTETQCELGLTALRSEDVMELMSKDYPEKYKDYIGILREKEKQTISEKRKEYAATSSDKTKVVDFKKKAMLSAAEYNAHLNQERREERRACFDLQTFTIHYPVGPKKALNYSTKPGSYPVALLPGQFQDYYKTYTSEELKYLPVNTVLYGPLKEMNSLRIPSDDSDSDDSSASDGSCSSSQETHDESSSESDKNSKHNLTKTATVVLEKCAIPENMHRPKVKPNAVCKICKRGKNEPGKETKVEELVHCSDCDNSGHPSCLDLTTEMVQVLKTYPWQCMDCKVCSHCKDPYDEDKMLFCDLCDRGYHTFCVGLKSLPPGKWICHKCGSCTMCGATQPGPDALKAQWQYDHAKTAPEAAANQRPKIMCQSCFKKKTTIK